MRGQLPSSDASTFDASATAAAARSASAAARRNPNASARRRCRVGGLAGLVDVAEARATSSQRLPEISIQSLRMKRKINPTRSAIQRLDGFRGVAVLKEARKPSA